MAPKTFGDYAQLAGVGLMGASAYGEQKAAEEEQKRLEEERAAANFFNNWDTSLPGNPTVPGMHNVGFRSASAPFYQNTGLLQLAPARTITLDALARRQYAV